MISDAVRTQPTNAQRLSLIHKLIVRKGLLQPLMLMAIVAITSALELFGVGALYWFVESVTNPDSTGSVTINAFGLNTVDQVSIGVGTLGLMIISIAVIKGLLGFKAVQLRVRFATRQSEILAKEIMLHNASQSYEQHLQAQTTDYIRRIFHESDLLGSQVILPAISIVTDVFFAGILVAFLLWYDVSLTLAFMLSCGLLYAALYLYFRPVLATAGSNRQTFDRARTQAALEFYGGLREIKLSGSWQHFVNRFISANASHTDQLIRIYSLPSAPSFLMQTFAMSAVVMLILWNMLVRQTPMSEALATTAVFGSIGWRLMPLFSAAVRDALTLQGSLPVLWRMRFDILRTPVEMPETPAASNRLKATRSIKLDRISYTYPGATSPAIQDITITIPVGASIGIVGPSGGGKSTIAEILLGLLPPSAGSLQIDERPVSTDQLPAWQRTIGYVPQTVFIADDSLIRNIAFGVSDDAIDKDRILQAIHLANLDDVIADLPDGLNSNLGERGKRLSGGQIQRIGIARALYRMPTLLLFDEATSALDTRTERRVNDAICKAGKGATTVFIAHRISTVRHCDTIFVIEEGRVVGSGRYDELIKTCPVFAELAKPKPITADVLNSP